MQVYFAHLFYRARHAVRQYQSHDIQTPQDSSMSGNNVQNFLEDLIHIHRDVNTVKLYLQRLS
jgi:hypothetical protein